MTYIYSVFLMPQKYIYSVKMASKNYIYSVRMAKYCPSLILVDTFREVKLI